MYKEKSDSNWDKHRKCHNEAKRQRQRAIKSCWRDKSNHLKENPADSYRTFMPFLSSKASKKSSQLNLTLGEEIVRNQDEVAETLAGYFATIADDIGQENVDSLTGSDFTNHPRVLKITQHSIQHEALAFKPIQKAEVQQVMETLKMAPVMEKGRMGASLQA